MCLPLTYAANVRLPYYGWFGQSGFSSERDARTWIASQYRHARAMSYAQNSRLLRPSYAARAYTIRPRLITIESTE